MSTPTPEERAELAQKILSVRWANGDRLTGITSRTAQMISEPILAAGYRKVTPITEDMVERAAFAYAGDEMTAEEWAWVKTQDDVMRPYLDGMRSALEAALGEQPDSAPIQTNGSEA